MDGTTEITSSSTNCVIITLMAELSARETTTKSLGDSHQQSSDDHTWA